MTAAGWFEGALLPDRVMQELNRCVPDFASGRQMLLACRITRIRSAPTDGSWTATYGLDVRDGVTGEQRSVAMHGDLTPPGDPLPDSADVPLGADGWSVSLPNLRLGLRALVQDDALPGLALIGDPVRATRLLDQMLRDAEQHAAGLPLTGCAPVVVDDKPGVRAAVLCRLSYTHPGRVSVPHAVVVKVHDDDSGARADAALRSLFAAGLGPDPVLGLAEPLAYDAELGLSVQQFIEHDTSLKELIRRAFEDASPEAWSDLAGAMTATGAAVAALHGSGVTFEESVSFDDELSTVRRKHAKLSAAVPDLEGRLGDVISRVESAAAATPADPLVPCHHSLRPAQVLVSGRRISIIDFDKVCRAEPASDIASLTTKLLHMATSKTAGAATSSERELKPAALRAAFLAEYRRGSAVSDQRLGVWEALELVSLELSAAKKMDPARIESCRRLTERHLAARGL